MRSQMGRRLLWLCLVLLLALSGLTSRLYQLQIVSGPEYARMAYRQRTQSLAVGSRRGMIFDRRGEPLTDPQSGWGVALFPPLITDRATVVRKLAEVTGRPAPEVLAQIEPSSVRGQADPDQGPKWFQTGLTLEQAARIERLHLSGVAVGPAGSRYGPNALARHLVGVANDREGISGLELAFDSELVGEAVPAIAASLDARGRPMEGLGIRASQPVVGKEPFTVNTTIDRRIQQAVERVLDSHSVPGAQPLRGAVVVMAPESGEVLAMASRPQFDYGSLGELMAGPKKQQELRLANRATSAFVPGSVFKTIVAAAALEGKYVSLDDKFYCPGHYEIGGTVFHDHENKAHGWITFQEAIAQSCNITFLKVGYERMGLQELEAAAVRFGFGRATGALGRTWQNEAVGTVPGRGDETLVQVAFGQGSLLVTPLQVARAYSAIANGGVLPTVRLITTVRSPEGEVKERPEYPPGERILFADTAQAMQKALRSVTDPGGNGTGRKAWVEQGGAAGKTGSAEAPGMTHAWFAGYLPLMKPKYVVAVMIEGGGLGGEVAAPIFREVGEAIYATAGF